MAAPLVWFMALYAVMYASFGVSSPFLPRFLVPTNAGDSFSTFHRACACQ